VGEFTRTEQDGFVAVVTSNHPPVNALSAPLLEELEAEIDRLDGDDAVRAILLVGAGERAFVAGADISEFPSLRQATAEAKESGSARGIQKLGHRMDAAHTPFVAAIHGFCLGGGLEVAMCCDIRVASDDAQLGQPEIKLGLIPGGGGTQRLPRFVGIGRALLLNLTGDFIDAKTAYEWGLVEKVVPREELRETALGIARTIGARSPVSVGILRELTRTTRDLPLEEGLRREADGFRRCLESEDGAEGVAAFLEKREPNFVGH
jgi:enoyl-CoA hydratase